MVNLNCGFILFTAYPQSACHDAYGCAAIRIAYRRSAVLLVLEIPRTARLSHGLELDFVTDTHAALHPFIEIVNGISGTRYEHEISLPKTAATSL